MGWIAFAGLAIAAGLLLWRLGFALRLWTLAGAALALAGAGYAWQGRPALAAAPARPAAAAIPDDSDRMGLRDAMLGRFGAESGYAIAGDAMLRAGAPDAAVRAILGGIAKYPDSLALWTELGSTLSIRDGALSPAARFAFQRAAALNPRHPAPPFFLGLAQVKAGEFVAARRSWDRAYALAPGDATYRREIAARRMLLAVLLEKLG